ncbi:MAG: OmpA family protein [Desulfobulbaceae bacterium]|nr:OmpA family protein [Desulfobulbaceae bacterium]
MKRYTALFGFLAAVFIAAELHADCSVQLKELDSLKGLIKRRAYLEKAIRQCPDDYQINYFYGYNLERLRKYDESLKFYHKSIKLNPDFPKAHFGLGGVYLVQGNFGDSIDSFEKGLRLDPENIWARRSLQKARSRFKEPSPPQQEKLPHDVGAVQEKQQHGDNSSIVNSVSIEPPEIKALSTEKKISQPFVSPAVTAESFIRHMTTIYDDRGGDASNHVLQMQIQFERSSGRLTESAMRELENVVCKALQSDMLADSRFEVAGHTDDSGDFELNMYLSRMRANSVKDFLVENCRIESDRLSVVYYGETRPTRPNTSVRNRQLNRRVEFRRLD